MAFTDDLITARNNLAEELRRETARRLTLVTAGDPPPTTYSFAGRNYDWNGYLRTVLEQIKALNEAVATSDIFEEVEHGYVGG